MPRRKNLPRKIPAAFLATGAALAIGVLAFAGMLVIAPGVIPLAILAAIFAGGIELVIYWRNIKASFKKMLTRDFLRNAILAAEINNLLDKNPNHPLLKEYKTQLDLVKKLKALPKNSKEYEQYISSLPLEKQKELPLILSVKKTELATAKQKLQVLQNDLNLKNFINENPSLHATIRRKILFIRLSWILVLISSAASGLVGINMTTIAAGALITYFSIPLAGIALSATVFGLAGLGALGYVFLTYNSLSDIIQNDTVRSWFEEIKRLKDKGNSPRLIGAIFLAVLVITLGIFATIATAGTWWYAVKATTHLLPVFSQMAVWLRDLVIPIVAIAVTFVTNFVYALTNSFESAWKLLDLPTGLQNVFKKLKDTLKNHWQQENLLQLLSPFRIIATLIECVGGLAIFIFHVGSMGLMGDRLANIPAVITAALNSGSEALNDGHHFAEKNTSQPDESGEHEPKQNNDQHGHEHGGHDHGESILTKALRAILIPLHFLSAGWDCLFSQLNKNAQDQLPPGTAWKKARGNALKIVPATQPATVSTKEQATTTSTANTYAKLAYQALREAREKLNEEYEEKFEQELSREKREALNNRLLTTWKTKTQEYCASNSTFFTNAATNPGLANQIVSEVKIEMDKKLATTQPQAN